MHKYRSASAEVEAVRVDFSDQPATRYRLDQIGVIPGHFPMPVRFAKACWWEERPPTEEGGKGTMVLVVSTPEGEIDAVDGDWIVKMSVDQIVPMKPDVFAATYEAVE